MALSKIRLGDYIERSTANNSKLQYGIELIEGVTNEGVFAPPKGNPMDVDLKPYKIVYPGAFVYNPSRLDLGSIAYRTGEMCIVSHLYIVFYLNAEGKKIIDPDYLFMYFRRKEFYREVTFRNFGSQRPEFNFNDMSDLEIPLPDITVQRKFVNIYKTMVANQQSYERGLEDLKMVCDCFIDKLKKIRPLAEIGQYVQQIDNRNAFNCNFHFAGLSMENYFIDSIADAVDIDFSKYKMVAPGEYGAVLMKVGRDGRLTIARNTSDETYLISPAYYTFTVHGIDADCFMANVSRSEFERRGWFSCDTSARGSLSWCDFCGLKIPTATKEEQKIIASLYKVQQERMALNTKLKEQIKNICPILIRGSLEE